MRFPGSDIRGRTAFLAVAFLVAAAAAFAGEARAEGTTLAEAWRVLTLRDYNTRVVVLGTMMLGAASGVVGTFLLLRKRSLLCDAVSHATLPGIAIAFMAMTAAGGTGKSLPGLLLGAAITGTLGMLAVLGIRRFTRLKDDAALGIVLSVFFGLGIALLNVVTRMKRGNAAGLEAFIYGKTASMVFGDAVLIGVAALAALVMCGLLVKEFSLVCFDQDFAATQGWPVALLDLAMMMLVVLVTVIGLQSVGLILVVALLVIPAAAARYWSFNLRPALLVSSVIGGLSGLLGSAASALLPNLPAGAIIVLVAAALFVFSLFLGSARGLVLRWLGHARLTRRIGRQHLLRALMELAEEKWLDPAAPRPVADVVSRRSWTPRFVSRTAAMLEREGLVTTSGAEIALTAEGIEAGKRVVRNHRLWELFLISHADIAPSHVDRNADEIEHVLDAEMVQRLEAMLGKSIPQGRVPASPH